MHIMYNKEGMRKSFLNIVCSYADLAGLPHSEISPDCGRKQCNVCMLVVNLVELALLVNSPERLFRYLEHSDAKLPGHNTRSTSY